MNEFSLIQHYFNRELPCTAASSVSLGIGDDAAILQPPAGQQLVITSDTLVAGRHFPLGTPAHAIGWKSVAVNLSDIAAMGARPAAVLLALSLPEFDAQWLQQFSQGFFACCQPDAVALIGGDTTRSQVLSITVTALGWVEAGKAVCRHGAQPGDLIVLSNTVGDAAYALKYPGSPLQDRLDYPRPQNQLGMALNGYASSMLDISDGLAQDLGHILKASKVGARLYLEQLPLAQPVQQLPLKEAWQLAFTGGDDYELCFTICPAQLAAFRRCHPTFKLQVIGVISAEQGLKLSYQGQPINMNLQGYQHFD